MKRPFASLKEDRGFTLSELLAALGLLGIVLGVTYGGFQVSHSYSRLSDRQAWMAREVAAPLQQMEKVLQQQYRIDSDYPGVTAYHLEVETDADNDDNREVWEFTATSDHRLLMSNAEVRQDGTYERAPSTYAWSESNYNMQTGTPLFIFYDKAGAQITNLGDVPSQAAKVVVTVVTMYDGHQFSDSRTILFRNQ
ncbi:MAG: prepilin-type N-terminal cleavage/methylation domain-containing protein [Actinomycetia bacterium]|nr:prepilin-type N-terminal cleavage/methylation domain-containing protein [Actinomycetes bacterium]